MIIARLNRNTPLYKVDEFVTNLKNKAKKKNKVKMYCNPKNAFKEIFFKK